jgi:hypothetical protein
MSPNFSARIAVISVVDSLVQINPETPYSLHFSTMESVSKISAVTNISA